MIKRAAKGEFKVKYKCKSHQETLQHHCSIRFRVKEGEGDKKEHERYNERTTVHTNLEVKSLR